MHYNSKMTKDREKRNSNFDLYFYMINGKVIDIHNGYFYLFKNVKK